jgi:hypothetical protein
VFQDVHAGGVAAAAGIQSGDVLTGGKHRDARVASNVYRSCTKRPAVGCGAAKNRRVGGRATWRGSVNAVDSSTRGSHDTSASISAGGHRRHRRGVPLQRAGGSVESL